MMMRYLLRLWVLMLGLGIFGIAQAEDFLPPQEAFQVQIKPQDKLCESNCLADVHIQIHSGYYLYRERFALKAGEGVKSLSFVELPHGTVKFDKNLGHEVEVLHDEQNFQLQYSLKPGAAQPEGKLVVQGCADAGLCYPPMPVEIPFKASGGLIEHLFNRGREAARGLGSAAPPVPQAANVTVTTPAQGEQVNSNKASATDVVVAGPTDDAGTLATRLQNGSTLGVLATFFGLGLLLAFTPCTFPMLPIVTSLVVGDSKKDRSGFRPVLLAFVYILGMAFTYAVLGVLAGLSGESLVVALQKPSVLWSFGGLLALLGFGMLAGFSIQIPTGVQAWLQEKTGRLQGGSVIPVLLMGVLSALLLGPCVAPPLAGALLFIGQTGNAFLGGLALFVLAFGMGLPMVLVAAGAGSILPRAGHWMEVINVVFGFMLLAVALWVVTPATSLPVMFCLWSVWALAAGMALWSGLPAKVNLTIRALVLSRVLALLFVLAGWVYGLGFFMGSPSLLTPLAGLSAGGQGESRAEHKGLSFNPIESSQVQAMLAASQKPVVLDFYADWCVSCKEFELFTLTDPVVKSSLQRYVRYRVDVTDNTEADKALMKQYRLYGPPAILFFAPGANKPVHQVIGFEDAPTFTETLKEVAGQLLENSSAN